MEVKVSDARNGSGFLFQALEPLGALHDSVDQQVLFIDFRRNGDGLILRHQPVHFNDDAVVLGDIGGAAVFDRTLHHGDRRTGRQCRAGPQTAQKEQSAANEIW